MNKLLLTIILSQFLMTCAYGMSPPPPPTLKIENCAYTWTAPTEREDGSRLLPSEIKGYQPYLDGNKYYTQTASMETSISFVRPSCPKCFQVTTFDSNGIESEFSLCAK